MAKTPAASPIVFGTDEWGTWATGVQTRLDELTAAANSVSSDGPAEKIAALTSRVEAVEKQSEGYDKAVVALKERTDALNDAAHKKGKSVSGDDVGARIAALETMLGLHPEHVTAEAEAKEDETLPS